MNEYQKQFDAKKVGSRGFPSPPAIRENRADRALTLTQNTSFWHREESLMNAPMSERQKQPEAKELGPYAFFSLPAEIRGDILNRALTLNAIFWHPQGFSMNGPMSACQNVASPSPLWNASLGCSDTCAFPGFLTASRQSYEEGMPFFYQNSVFFLPLGPLDITVTVFEQVRPEYRSLIKNFGLTMDCRDLGYGFLGPIKWRRESEKVHCTAWLKGEPVQRALQDIWNKKLEWIKSQRNVEKVVIQCEFGSVLRKKVHGIPGCLTKNIAEEEGRHMASLVERHGWKKLRSALDAEISLNDRAPNNELWNYKKENRTRLEYSTQNFP